MDKEFYFMLYRAADEDISANALIANETLWLTQKAMAELFACSADNISLHLKNIYAEGELSEQATTEEFSAVQLDSAHNLRL